MRWLWIIPAKLILWLLSTKAWHFVWILTLAFVYFNYQYSQLTLYVFLAIFPIQLVNSIANNILNNWDTSTGPKQPKRPKNKRQQKPIGSNGGQLPNFEVAKVEAVLVTVGTPSGKQKGPTIRQIMRALPENLKTFIGWSTKRAAK